MRKCPNCSCFDLETVWVNTEKNCSVMHFRCKTCKHQDDVIKFYGQTTKSITIE